MYRKTVLDNGLRILTEKVPHVRSVAIGIWVDVGSRDESPQFNGISHFIEHMMFKGTARRTAKEVAEALDAVGGQLNAFTTKEYTCYYARVLDEYFDLAVDLLTDMLLNSRLDSTDIEKEKNVIVEEIKMYEDAPDEIVHDVFAGTMWQGHALGRPVIGMADVIAGLGRDEIVQFYRANYTSDKMVVTVAGNITHKAVLERLTPLLGTLQRNGSTRVLEAPVPVTTVNCRTKDTEQVHICLGTPGFQLDHELIYGMQVLNIITGGGISSRLFQEIREQRGLVYSVYSYHNSYHDAGLFCIYAGLSANNVPAAIELIFKELRLLKEQGVAEDELIRAKQQLKGAMLLSLESVNSRMSRLGRSELYLGTVHTPAEIVERLSAVSAREVQDLAALLFRPDNFTLAAVGHWTEGCDAVDLIGRSGL